jgi:prepilin-type N-terminal cleavage/methylation domain-containing protein
MTTLAQSRRHSSAFTLAEVMVSMLIFALASAGISGIYLRSVKSSAELRYRTMASSTALNILEQVRVLNYNTLKAKHDTATAGTTIPVLIADPTAIPATGIPLGYKAVNLYINVLDGTQIYGTTTSGWTQVSIPMETATTSPQLSMQFWLTIQANVSTVTPIVQVIELALIYQWKNPGGFSQNWQSGTIHCVVPNPSPL